MAFSLVVAFFVLGASPLNAQSQTIDADNPLASLYNPPQGNFVVADEALTILGNALAILKSQLESLVPGTPLYIATEAKYLYFQTIEEKILNGIPVPQAIIDALVTVAVAPASSGVISQDLLLQFKNEAIDLLSI
jgi:hypothetical protein